MEPKEESIDSFEYMPAGKEIDNGRSPLVGPKEEPLEDFLLNPAENETVTQSVAIVKEEAKEEPVDLINSFLAENEVPPLDSTVKEEPVDEYFEDSVRLGQNPSWDDVLDQSVGCYNTSPVLVAPKFEEVEYQVLRKSFPLLSEVYPLQTHSLDSVEDFKEPSILLDNNKRKPSLDKVVQSSSSTKKARLTKETNLKCPECEYHSEIVLDWRNHLRKEHCTTAELAGLALRCDCGHESQSGIHMCSSINLSVIRKRDGPIRRLDDKKVAPQCLLCKTLPSTAAAYAFHLAKKHNSTLAANGIFLRCSCGVEFRSTYRNLNHSEDCDPREYSLHKLECNLQCVKCEIYPATAYAYSNHLYSMHRTTLKKVGIYLFCSCGVEVRSSYRTIGNVNHMTCDSREFTLHKIIDE